MEAYVGEIRLFAGNFAPANWVLCNGQGLSTSRYTPLYSIIGNSYGGNASTFNVPDLRGKVPINYGAGPGLSPKPFASSGGGNFVSLSVEQMPTHNHQALAGGTADQTTPDSNYWSNQPGARGGRGYAATSNTTMAPLILQFTGGGQPHENRQPFLAMNYIICFSGVYPPKPSEA